MHPQTTKPAQEKVEEDTMDLLMRMNQRLIAMEQELEKALQAKQGELSSEPPEIAPIVTNAPPTVAVAIRPIIPASTTGTSATNASVVVAIIAPDSSMSMEGLMKVVKELEVQMSELKEAKERFAKLEVSYDKSKITVVEKTREIKALENKVKSLEKDLTLHKTLTEIKTILWTKIGQSINDQWTSIQTIHDQIELIGIAQFETQKAKALLANKPE